MYVCVYIYIYIYIQAKISRHGDSCDPDWACARASVKCKMIQINLTYVTPACHNTMMVYYD